MRKAIDTRLIRAQLTAQQQAFLRSRFQRLHEFGDSDDDTQACLFCGVVVTFSTSTMQQAYNGCLPVVNLSDLLDIAKTRSASAYTNAVNRLTQAGEPIDNVFAYLKAGF